MPLLVDVRQLSVINELIREGVASVADSVGTLAGVDTTIDIKSLAFVDPADLPAEIGSEEVYAATIDLTEPPYGSFVLTFSEDTASSVAELVADQPVEGELTSMQESTLQEMCNICTSGFIDGFANTLNTTIDVETPNLERDHTDEIAEETVSHVRMDSLSIVLDSVVDLAERDTEFQLRIFLVPDPGSFVNIIDKLDIEEIREKENLTDVYEADGGI